VLAAARPLRISVLTAAAGLAMLGVGCNRSDEIRSQALAGSTPVTITTTDGVTLAGRLFGDDSARTGVVFAHMLPADQSSWFDLAEYVAQRGYRALTFDFRGYCPGGDAGCSKGERDPSAAAVDLRAAVRFLRAQGIHRLGLVGASMGGTASLVVAGEETGVSAVVTLSAPDSIGGLSAGPDVLQAVTAAKMFMAGNGDTTAAAAAQAFYDQSQQPKDLQILTSNDHGTDLLEGNQSQVARDQIVGWLERFAPA
jgi:pimeloyl-ACP methyl ester carboxylesterase